MRIRSERSDGPEWSGRSAYARTERREREFVRKVVGERVSVEIQSPKRSARREPASKWVLRARLDPSRSGRRHATLRYDPSIHPSRDGGGSSGILEDTTQQGWKDVGYTRHSHQIRAT